MEEFLFKYNLFYIIVFILTLVYAVYLENVKFNKANASFDSAITVFILLICIIGIGFRDFSVGTDTENYIRDFFILSRAPNIDSAIEFIRGGGDPLFTVITYYSTRVGDERFYLLVLAILFVLPYFIFISKNGTGNKKLLLLLAFLSVYSFKWMAVNTVRSGIAIGFGLLFVSSLYLKETKKYILYGFIAVSFHVSALIFIVSGVAVKYFRQNVIWVFIYFVSSLVSFLGFGVQNIPFFKQLERAGSYIEGEKDYQTGFLFTYWLYNTLIAIYCMLLGKKIKDEYYNFLFCLFLVLSSIYFLCFHIPFSDRIGVFSWALIPLLVSYPFLNNRLINKARYLVLCFILLCFQMLAIFYLKR